jgi:hypothetical protein
MAVSYLEKNGILGSKASCHSPFRYLVSAADDVLKVAHRHQPAVAASVGDVETDSKQIKQRAQAVLAAFESNLTEVERESFISRFVEEEYTWGYVPSKSLLTRLAADRWYAGHQNVQLQASAG